MAIRDVVLGGFGNGTFSGTIPLVVTRGYAIGVEAPATPERGVSFIANRLVHFRRDRVISFRSNRLEAYESDRVEPFNGGRITEYDGD